MSPPRFEIEPFFLDGEQGALFCNYLFPKNRTPKGGILYLHPFAEEMHKSRRMAALQARAFAADGYAVLQLDLTGCGDSAGDFADASWGQWLRDSQRACDWLAAKIPGAIRLWGLRSGGSLAVELASTRTDIASLLLWQPVIHGEPFLNQFLRIKTASGMLSQGQSQNSVKTLRAELNAGKAQEVGGYTLSSTMASELAAVQLSEFKPACPVIWREVGFENSDLLAPASQRVALQWRGAGVKVQTQTVTGEAFWLTQEITECPALIEAGTP